MICQIKSEALHFSLETPPRAWGRPSSSANCFLAIRNTPTGVGKTKPKPPSQSLPGKHPHGRGEDPCEFTFNKGPAETPPRAWGRLQSSFVVSQVGRNTPTGVGKTTRVTIASLTSLETPPRAWGRPLWRYSQPSIGRNTPTGVGKTALIGGFRCGQRKHPHGRGEDRNSSDHCTKSPETPPRAWGRLRLSQRFGRPVGNTPTGVGKTH